MRQSHRPTTTPSTPPRRPTARTPERPPLIGLTGAIGAGKSTALAAFAGFGCAVIDADRVVHDLYGRAAVRDAVQDRFGAALVDAAGTVDRAALGRVVFGDPAARTWLEALIHPLVRDALARWRAEAAAAVPPPLALVEEVALLLESGRPAEYDHIVVIVADAKARRARIAARGHLEGLDAREARLLTDEGRIVHADTVIRNDGDPAALVAAVRACLDRVAAR